MTSTASTAIECAAIIMCISPMGWPEVSKGWHSWVRIFSPRHRNVLFNFMYNENMNAVTYSEARNNLAHYLDKVVDDVDATIITRQRGEPAVLMSLREYEQWRETLHLLGRGNAKRLLTAVDDVAAARKRVRARSLAEE